MSDHEPEEGEVRESVLTDANDWYLFAAGRWRRWWWRWPRRAWCFLCGRHVWPQGEWRTLSDTELALRRRLGQDPDRREYVEPDVTGCERCGIAYETYERQRKRQVTIQRWSPVWVTRGRWHAHLILGWPWRFYAKAGVTIRGYGSYPSLDVSCQVWVVRMSAWLGGFWQVDEDGEERSLAGATLLADFASAKMALCRLRGHDPREWGGGYIVCRRCEATIASPPREEYEVVSAPDVRDCDHDG